MYLLAGRCKTALTMFEAECARQYIYCRMCGATCAHNCMVNVTVLIINLFRAKHASELILGSILRRGESLAATGGQVALRMSFVQPQPSTKSAIG